MVLSTREKRLLIAGVILLSVIFLGDQLLVPAFSKGFSYKSELLELKTINRRLSKIESEIKFYQSRIKENSASMEIVLQKVIRSYGVEKVKITGDPDNSKRLSLTLEESNLDTVVGVLYKLQNSVPVIRIEKLDISPSFTKKGYLRVSCLLSGR